MDTVRIGRALGFGARQAMKTLITVVDAATAGNPAATSGITGPGTAPKQTPNSTTPSTPGARPQIPVARTPDTSAPKTAHATVRTVVQARGVTHGLRRGSKRLGEAVWGPFVRLSGVLWLEVSGVFFGIFALLALGYLWKLRGAWHSSAASAATHRSMLGAIVMLALFGYFSVSSFVRARRRERRR